MKKNWVRQALIVYVSILLPVLTYCQINVSGTVLTIDEKPIGNVTVLLKNSTIHTESDSSGYFHIFIPPNVVEKELFLTRIGFKDTTINYNYLISDKVIFMNSTEVLNEVVIKKKKSFLLKNQLKQIESSLIGNDYYSKFCEIQNLDSFIIITNKDHSFNYYSNEFIVIINKALGYKIKAKLGVCTINGRSKKFDVKSVQYIPLIPSGEKEKMFFEKNREKIFYTSSKGFFSSLARKTYDEDFIIYKSVVNEPLNYPMSLSEEVKDKKLVLVHSDSIIITTIKEEKYHLSIDKPLFVFLKKEKSENLFFYDTNLNFFICDFLKDSMTFDKFGNTYLPFSYIAPDNTDGYFNRLLPKDYLPISLK